MRMTREDRAQHIINEGRFHLKRHLEDFPTAYPKIGVPFGRKDWEFIQNNLELVREIGRKNNVYVFLADDGSKCIYVEYIQEKVHKK